MPIEYVILAPVGVLVLYRIYRRLRRNFGWQRLNARRLRKSAVILTLAGIVLFTLSSSHTSSLISGIAGFAVGAVLAFFGAAITKFERRGDHLHYLPNSWIGAIVTVLFLGRLVSRIAMAATQTELAAAERWQGVAGGWTAGLILVMVSYYAVYNLLLLRRWKRELQNGTIAEG